ncbi:MAG: flagellar hook-basal body complex protein FliE [Steroidobacteraceae bacterium]
MSVDSVLSQIRALSAQVKPVASPRIDAGAAGATVEKSGFSSVLTQTLNQVNQTQQNASNMATKFERGVPGVELSDVMLEMQKASVSFRGVTEVRNRMVSAYQEIMNMQI